MVELWKRIVHKRSRDLSERARASALTHTDFYSLIFFQTTTPNVPRIWMDTTSTYPYHKTRIHFLSSDGKILAVQFDYFFVFCLHLCCLILFKVLFHFAVELFLNFVFLLYPKSWLARVTCQHLSGCRLSLLP